MAAKKYTPPGGWYAYEKAAAEKGYSSICGIDEAGRGPLAGPVFAAAVIVALPILVVFVFLQKYFIQGVVVSGVKG